MSGAQHMIINQNDQLQTTDVEAVTADGKTNINTCKVAP